MVKLNRHAGREKKLVELAERTLKGDFDARAELVEAFIAGNSFASDLLITVSAPMHDSELSAYCLEHIGIIQRLYYSLVEKNVPFSTSVDRL
jgi:hypothetical protein